jgi:Type II secretion system (T2SS), protein G
MRYVRFSQTLAASLAVAAMVSCGGPVPSRVVREQVASLGGAELSPDDVQVERIIQQTSTQAVAEFTVQMAGQYVRNAEGDWELVSIRLGTDDWVDLSRFEDALTRVEIEETASNLRMLAAGIEAYQRANGDWPATTPESGLPDLLHPTFVPELVREDAWGQAFLYEASGNTFRIRSSGPDQLDGTDDDIEVSGPAGDSP